MKERSTDHIERAAVLDVLDELRRRYKPIMKNATDEKSVIRCDAMLKLIWLLEIKVNAIKKVKPEGRK